ncbi:hypothetical protein ACVWXL_005873 [Bradyrhizobium sp. GM22.5]
MPVVPLKATIHEPDSAIGQFVRDFVPPDYVVDRIFQRRFYYSMTAKSGGGKTAAAMRSQHTWRRAVRLETSKSRKAP